MNTPLNDLILQVQAAEGVLRYMSDMGMDCTEQIIRCRELRRAMNAQCPDGSLSPYEFNIVEKPV